MVPAVVYIYAHGIHMLNKWKISYNYHNNRLLTNSVYNKLHLSSTGLKLRLQRRYVCVYGAPAIRHMHDMQCDRVIWTGSPLSSTLCVPWDNSGNTLTACLTVSHALLCHCVYLAWQPNSQRPHGADRWHLPEWRVVELEDRRQTHGRYLFRVLSVKEKGSENLKSMWA